MMTAKPLQVFRLGSKRIVVCQVHGENPMHFLGQNFAFYAEGRPAAMIRIEGVSTANDASGEVFDFLYTGDEILPHLLGENSILTNITIDEA